MLTISYCYADSEGELNTSMYFALTPARAINRSGKARAYTMHINDFVQGKPECNHLLEKSDIILVERNLLEQTIKAIEYWKNKGKLVLIWFDDNYDTMRPSNISYPYWSIGKITHKIKNKKGIEVDKIEYIEPYPIISFKKGLGIGHAFITPSKFLTSYFSEYGRGYFLPNRFEIRNYINKPIVLKKTDDIIIGAGMSLSHVQSYEESGILGAIKRITKSNPRVKFMICGDKRIYDAIHIDNDKKIFTGYVPAEQWPDNINQFDIGIAPLYGGYDNCRSWIKIAEYWLMKKPYVASYGEAYKDYEEHGKLVKNSPKNWADGLLDVIENYFTYKKLANDIPYEYALENCDINKNVDNILNLYRQIAEDVGLKLNN